MLFDQPPVFLSAFTDIDYSNLTDRRALDVFFAVEIRSDIDDVKSKLNIDLIVGLNRIQLGQSAIHLIFSEKRRLVSKSIVHRINHKYNNVDALKGLVSRVGCINSKIHTNDVKEVSRNSVEFSKIDGKNIAYARANFYIDTWIVCGLVDYSHLFENSRGFRNYYGGRF